jgi:hypothetical protein
MTIWNYPIYAWKIMPLLLSLKLSWQKISKFLQKGLVCSDQNNFNDLSSLCNEKLSQRKQKAVEVRQNICVKIFALNYLPGWDLTAVTVTGADDDIVVVVVVDWGSGRSPLRLARISATLRRSWLPVGLCVPPVAVNCDGKSKIVNYRCSCLNVFYFQ